MAAFKWFTTKHKGLRYREHDSRKHGIRKDRFYQYRMMTNGKRVQESFGWLSEGWTEEKCLVEVAKLKQSKVTGEGPATLKEKRQAAEAKRKTKEREQVTFNDVWSKYLPQAKADRGEKSLIREESMYRLWIEPVIGDKPLKIIAPIHLEKVKSIMAREGKAPRTIQYTLAIIRQIFNYAKNHDLFTGDNPAKKVKKPKFDNMRVRFLSYDDADSLLSEIKKKSLQTHDMTLLSLHTGMRAGEIFSLTWGDIDFERGIITLWNTKNKRTRSAFMTDSVKDMLLTRKPKDHEPTALVFPGRGGVKIRQISDTFNRAVAKVGFNTGIKDPRQKVCFHTMRHTFASWLVENGTDLYTVKELLGHSDFKMTSRYAHLGENSLQAAVKGLERTISEVTNLDSVVQLTKQA
jgi:integrase